MDSKTANTFSSSNMSGFRKQWHRIHIAERQEKNKTKPNQKKELPCNHWKITE